MKAATRLLILSLGVAVVAATTLQVGAATVYPGLLLAKVAGTAVFSTVGQPQTRTEVCPRATVPLTAASLREAASAVAAAMPSYYRHAQRQGRRAVDTRGATARGSLATRAHSGTSLRGFCGQRVWSRSAFVSVRLPRVRHSASLAAPTFLVARGAVGWVIWAEVH